MGLDRSPLILLVDSALDDCVQLGMTLRRERCTVLTVGALAEARLLLGSLQPDVVIFDRTLPDGDGLELCSELSSRHPAPFLVALTDRTDETDRLLGFEAGLDDYIAKPFSPQEVAFRVRAMLRRARHTPEATGFDAFDEASASALRIGALVVDPDLHEIMVDGERVPVTPVEFQVMLALARNPRLVLSRDQLVDHVWGASWNGDTHALDVHVSNLRRKLSPIPRDQTFVRSVRGVGYRLGTCQPAGVLIAS